jgi:hypothetical protein
MYPTVILHWQTSVAAQAHLFFCNYKTVCERYLETLAAEFVRGRCDKYADYHAEGKRFAYLGER